MFKRWKTAATRTRHGRKQQTRAVGRTTLEVLERRCNPATLAAVDHPPALIATEAATTHSASTQSVIGTDERIAVANSGASPFAAVVKLEITFPSGRQITATGAMVSKFHLLTAAHVVYRADQGGYATKILASVAMNGADALNGQQGRL